MRVREVRPNSARAHRSSMFPPKCSLCAHIGNEIGQVVVQRLQEWRGKLKVVAWQERKEGGRGSYREGGGGGEREREGEQTPRPSRRFYR